MHAVDVDAATQPTSGDRCSSDRVPGQDEKVATKLHDGAQLNRSRRPTMLMDTRFELNETGRARKIQRDGPARSGLERATGLDTPQGTARNQLQFLSIQFEEDIELGMLSTASRGLPSNSKHSRSRLTPEWAAQRTRQ